MDWNTYHLEELRSRMLSPHCSGSLNSSENFQRFQEVNEKGKGDGKAGFENGPRVLPFEFIALEACLEAACSCLDNEVNRIFLFFFFANYFCHSCSLLLLCFLLQ